MGENRKEERGFDKIVETIKIVEKGVVNGYKAVESATREQYKTVEEGYKSIEKGVVNGYKAVENATREQYKSIEETALRITKFAERNKKHD